MSLRIVLTALTLAALFRASNPSHLLGRSEPVLDAIQPETPHTLLTTAPSSFNQATIQTLDAPATEYLAHRQSIKTLVSDHIPKLSAETQAVFTELFNEKNAQTALTSLSNLDREIEKFLDPENLDKDQLTNAHNLAKLAVQATYSSRGLDFLTTLLTDIHQKTATTPLAQTIQSSLFRSRIVSWLETKRDQLQLIRNKSPYTSPTAFINLTFHDPQRARVKPLITPATQQHPYPKFKRVIGFMTQLTHAGNRQSPLTPS